MHDKKIIEFCAMAMGWQHLGAVDERTRGENVFCREGGNDWWRNPHGHWVCGKCQSIPNPLEESEAALNLVRALRLHVVHGDHGWEVFAPGGDHNEHGESDDLLRAIATCAAIAERKARG